MFVESLESRRLLSVSITVVDGTMTVQGSGDADNLRIEEVGGNVSVEDDGAFVGAGFGITRLIINGGDGNDTLDYIGNSLGAEIFGDNGDDGITVEDAGAVGSTIRGNNGEDSITIVQASSDSESPTTAYGDNMDDILVGSFFGYQVLNGGNGSDLIAVQSTGTTADGGNGSDTILVVADGATVTGGNGNDTITNG